MEANTTRKPEPFEAAAMFVMLTPTLADSKNSEEIYALLGGSADGEVHIEGAHADRYLLTRTDGKFELTYPEGDYSGDPTVVANFNKIIAVHS